jgi:RES domain-containing protein
MKLYRISRSEYIDDLNGTGAKLYGGRWNEKGTALLYCSENISLAILEILVHFDGLTIPSNLELLHLELEDKQIENFSISKFEKIRASKDSEFRFKTSGQSSLKSGKKLALKVPSIITPGEFNILINPSHSNLSFLKVIKKEKLELDKRLFK